MKTLFAGMLPLFISPAVYDQRHNAASANLARARREAREHGEERRKAIHDKVREIERRRAEQAVEASRQRASDVTASNA